MNPNPTASDYVISKIFHPMLLLFRCIESVTTDPLLPVLQLGERRLDQLAFV